MYSGITERINKAKKLSLEEKAELKELIKRHIDTIRAFLEDTNLPISVQNALEDRLITFNNEYLKL